MGLQKILDLGQEVFFIRGIILIRGSDYIYVKAGLNSGWDQGGQMTTRLTLRVQST